MPCKYYADANFYIHSKEEQKKHDSILLHQLDLYLASKDGKEQMENYM
jgi:glucan phosphoethanolaminetransferase (alkaline phosphatase superfamily)